MAPSRSTRSTSSVGTSGGRSPATVNRAAYLVVGSTVSPSPSTVAGDRAVSPSPSTYSGVPGGTLPDERAPYSTAYVPGPSTSDSASSRPGGRRPSVRASTTSSVETVPAGGTGRGAGPHSMNRKGPTRRGRPSTSLYSRQVSTTTDGDE
ncbi:hypothetical protein BRD13_04365 [Halobacteriales archaeon SW_5_70_135]|nr:MAG: hypothetical protein BRD13_04365 [Halobacteriales archaeon SW_5_70_135]